MTIQRSLLVKLVRRCAQTHLASRMAQNELVAVAQSAERIAFNGWEVSGCGCPMTQAYGRGGAEFLTSSDGQPFVAFIMFMSDFDAAMTALFGTDNPRAVTVIE